MSEPILTHEYLKEHLHYSVITGEFYWIKVKTRGKKPWFVAGSTNTTGYRQIKISGRSYSTNRLAWFWVTGQWPEVFVDHKNGIKDANQWLNLREATRSQNNCNVINRFDNTSGFKGVSWHEQQKKWYAYINLNKKRVHLGYYKTIELAYAARLKAEKEMHCGFSATMRN